VDFVRRMLVLVLGMSPVFGDGSLVLAMYRATFGEVPLE